MARTRNPHATLSEGRRSAQMAHMEADLARIVGPLGTRALLARSRQLCGAREQSCARLMQTLLQLVRKFLGQSLEQWLLQSAAGGVPARAERGRRG